MDSEEVSLELYRSVPHLAVSRLEVVDIGPDSTLEFGYILDGERIVRGRIPVFGSLRLDMGNLSLSSGRIELDLKRLHSEGPGHAQRILRALRESAAGLESSLSFLVLGGDLGSAPSTVGASFGGRIDLSLQLAQKSVDFPLEVRVERRAPDRLHVVETGTPLGNLRHLLTEPEMEGLMASLSGYELIPQVGLQLQVELVQRPPK